eukprot:COSAG01_NODE_408_length_17382_cov_6.231431_12_plen_513_part_00
MMPRRRMQRLSSHLRPAGLATAFWANGGSSPSGGGGGGDATPLRAATFALDVTPPLGTPLMHGGVQPAADIVTPLTAKGVVLLGVPGGPVVLCSVDWVGISNASYDRLRQALAAGAGTERQRVALHTVHQHDAPGSDSATEELLASRGLGGLSMVEPYLPKVAADFEEAVSGAIGSAVVVTHAGTGAAAVERVASNRHIMDERSGLVRLQRQSSTGGNSEAAAAPEGMIDPQLRCLGLWSQARAIASISYYATHPMCNYGKGGVQWDFIGMARQQHEEQTLPHGAMAIHFTGAAGNVAAGKYNDGQPSRKGELAGRVSMAMRAAWSDAAARRTPLTTGRDVHWLTEAVALPLKPELAGGEEQLLAAIDSEESGAGAIDDPRAVYPRLRAARDLIYARRVCSGHTIDLTCLQIGGAFVMGMPGELFVQFQLAAQQIAAEVSDGGGTVLMAAYGDLGPGYIGTAASYSYGPLCYETGAPSRVSAGSEEVLLAGMRNILTRAAAAAGSAGPAVAH